MNSVPPKMTGREVLAEVQWLLDGGVHPELIAQQLGRSVEAINRMARRHRQLEIARVFNQAARRYRTAA